MTEKKWCCIGAHAVAEAGVPPLMKAWHDGFFGSEAGAGRGDDLNIPEIFLSRLGGNDMPIIL